MRAAGRARSSLQVGAALAVVYAIAAVLTGSRPLFDGFAPPTPYRWVNPPREFRTGNMAPRPSTVEVPLGPGGSFNASGSSEDGQVILSFGEGTLPAHPPDTKVIVQITPVDPAVLAPPPAGLATDGNAYRLDFAHDPSRQPITELAMPADLFLVVPEPAQTLLFSPDGRTWENLPFRPVPDPTQIAGAFTRPGYFLAVAPPVGRPSDTGSGDEGSRVLAVGAVTVALALLLGFAPVAWRRVRGSGGAP
ncbi:MAG: hypothetical protein ACRD2W_01695 [Acidimicrobiales bacterium]